jgi:hypothetical protein
MWTTLVLHMHARYYVLNCGSHWHALIRQLRTSCASPGTFFCLNHQSAYIGDLALTPSRTSRTSGNHSLHEDSHVHAHAQPQATRRSPKPLVDVPPMYGPGTHVPTNLAISPFGSTDD